MEGCLINKGVAVYFILAILFILAIAGFMFLWALTIELLDKRKVKKELAKEAKDIKK